MEPPKYALCVDTATGLLPASKQNPACEEQSQSYLLCLSKFYFVTKLILFDRCYFEVTFRKVLIKGKGRRQSRHVSCELVFSVVN